MTLWLIDEEARAHWVSDSFAASFFVYGSNSELHDLCKMIRAARLPVQLRRAERYDLFLRRAIQVLEIVVTDPARFLLIVQTVRRFKPALTYYNCTVPLAQMYLYAHGLFALARVEVETNASNRIRTIQLCDSRWAIDYALPPLKVMTMRLEGDTGNPNHGAFRRALEIGSEGTTRVLLDDDPRELLTRINELLKWYDPDLIVSQYGDSFIFPRLLGMSHRVGMPLLLNRDPSQVIQVRRARSYYSYGRVVFRSASHSLFGRLHLDLEDAFLFGDYGFDGLYEMARLAQMSIQRVARTSTGTCLTSMEMSTAYQERILIPSVKREAEMFQSADQLPLTDKGGLVFQPVVGLHEQVAELDFASMFPSIMDKFNVSAETLNCSCCADSRVPELALTVCQKRRGLVPATLAPVIAKRRQLKEKIKVLPPGSARDRYKRLASCGKWIGVVSFGYLGHSNAIYGNITAHQAICAFARDRLLLAKEIAEAHGFRMLHAIVDAIYVQKKNARAEEYVELVDEISRGTGLKIDLEGIYNWIAFLPSRQDPLLPVANRYFGVFQDGEIKIRGIEARRGDTPEFIKYTQIELLDEMAKAGTRAELGAMLSILLEMVADRVGYLRAGHVPMEDLMFTYRLSREPQEHARNTLNAIVARELAGRGVSLEAGESIRYVITDHAASVPSDRARSAEFLDGSWGYDVKRYTEILLRAVGSILTPLGINAKMVESWLAKELPAEHLRARLKKQPAREYWGPLFEYAFREQVTKQSIGQ